MPDLILPAFNYYRLSVIGVGATASVIYISYSLIQNSDLKSEANLIVLCYLEEQASTRSE